MQIVTLDGPPLQCTNGRSDSTATENRSDSSKSATIAVIARSHWRTGLQGRSGLHMRMTVSLDAGVVSCSEGPLPLPLSGYSPPIV